MLNYYSELKFNLQYTFVLGIITEAEKNKWEQVKATLLMLFMPFS